MKRLITILLLLLPCMAQAVPSIDTRTGTMSHGQPVTLTGTGFGTKSAAAPVAFGDMENNSVNARIGTWTGTGNGAISVSSQHPRHSRSTYNGMCNITSETWCGFRGGSDAAQWFVQYWFYLGSDWSWNDLNNKVLRMWSTSDSTVNLRVQLPFGHTDIVVEDADVGHGGWGTGWQPVTSQYTCADQAFGHVCTTDYWSIYPGSTQWTQAASDMGNGQWHLFQFEYRDGSVNQANGVLRWWVDGKLIFDHADITTRTSTDSTYKRPELVGLYSSPGSGSTGHYYIDDAYIDNTWQRVEIGNNSNYNSCTLKEIQPATSWSNTSVTFTVNQGAFNNGDTGYIFVTDASGTRNTAYSVQFGGAAPLTSSIRASGRFTAR